MDLREPEAIRIQMDQLASRIGKRADELTREEISAHLGLELTPEEEDAIRNMRMRPN